MARIIALAASAVIVAAAIATPAGAATESECKEAIAKTQRDMESNAGVMMENDSTRDGWDEALVRAGGYGEEGDPDRCLEEVRVVREQAGLRN